MAVKAFKGFGGKGFRAGGFRAKGVRAKGVRAMALSTSCLAMSTPAFAQLDEIVVTAQKREQSLQDVPISITAFDIDAIEKNRISGLEDIAKFSPGVYTTPNPADEGGVRVNIRGIGTFDPQIGQDSRTAIYVDGVYYGRTQGLAFDSPDLARVEILKGPQGSLYGRNSVSGAVNIISATPTLGKTSGAIDMEYGNFDHKRVKGHLNLPMGDEAALRVSGLYSDRDGWVENTGRGENFAGTERLGGRAALRFEPTDRFSLDVAADYTNTKSTPFYQQPVLGTDTGAPQAPNIFPDLAPINLFVDAVTPPRGTGRQDSVRSFVDIENGKSEVWGVMGTLNYEPADHHNLKLTIAHREADSRRFVALIPTADPEILNQLTGEADVNSIFPGTQTLDSLFAGLPAAFQTVEDAVNASPANSALRQSLDGIDLSLRSDFGDKFGLGREPFEGIFISPKGGTPSLTDHKQFSAELTYTGEFKDGKVQYTGGLFYYDEETGNAGELAPNDRDATSILFASSEYALAAAATNNFTLDATGGGAGDGIASFIREASLFFANEARQSPDNTLKIDTKAFAVYGEATVNITDEFRITAGLRYSDDKKDGVGQSFSPFFFDTTDLLGNEIIPNIGESDTSSLDPSFIAEWDVAKNILFYGSYKESFRSGGFNAAAVAPPPKEGEAGANFIFDKEEIAAYETGIKSDFNEGRFRLNVAGYFYDFEDFQTTVTLNPNVATARAIVNADQEIWGVDLETALLMTDELTGTFTYAYVDGKQEAVTNPATGEVTKQDGLIGAPKNSFTVGLDYKRPLSAKKTVFANASYSYKDDALSIPQQGNASELNYTQQQLLSARIGMGFDMDGRDVTIALWGENLADYEYTIDGLPFNAFAYVTEVYGTPRTYGISAGVKF